jgi:hypothetical protein
MPLDSAQRMVSISSRSSMPSRGTRTGDEGLPALACMKGLRKFRINEVVGEAGGELADL